MLCRKMSTTESKRAGVAKNGRNIWMFFQPGFKSDLKGIARNTRNGLAKIKCVVKSHEISNEKLCPHERPALCLSDAQEVL